MQNQKISVIIPVYNVEKYLRECIDSVCAQTYRDLEIILVDDGSTDSSGAICEEYALKDGRVIVTHKPNGGASEARNLGLNAAKGIYVYFMDSDDILADTALAEAMTCLEKDQLDVVLFDADCINENGEGTGAKNYRRTRAYECQTGENVLRQQLKAKDYKVAPWMYVYRRSFLEEHNIRFMTGIICEDELFSYQTMICAKRCASLNKVLYQHRFHGSSVMGSSRNTERRFVSMHQIIDAILKNDTDHTEMTQVYAARLVKSLLCSYYEMPGALQKAYKQQLQQVKDLFAAHAYCGDMEVRLKCRNWYLGKIYAAIAHRL